MKAGLFQSYLAAILIAALSVFCLPQLSQADTGDELVRLFRPFPGHFNSAISNDLSITTAAASIFVSLLELDDTNQARPYLAIWWNLSHDRKTYTFYLQAETVFHDGTPVTADDVVFSFEVFRQNHPDGKQMFRNVAEVEAPDELTFILHLSEPDPSILHSLAAPFMPILPASIYGNGNLLQNPANVQPVGSGPYRLTEFQAGERFVLERFDHYLRPGRPGIERIVGLSGDNPWFAVSALNSGIAHLFTFAEHPDILNLLSENTDLQINSMGYEQVGGMDFLEFNLRKKNLKNQKVRQAIAHAIDLEQISAAVYNDYALALDGPLPLNSVYHKAGGSLYNPDLELAEQLLEEARLPRDETGIRFSTRLTWEPDLSGSREIIAAYIKTQLAKIGIEVTLDPPQSYIDWYIQVAKWQHHMNLSRILEWSNPAVKLHPLFRSKHLSHRLGENTAGFYDESADVILEAAEKEPDPQIRSQLYHQFQILVREKLPLYFMHEAPFVTIIDRNLQNFPAYGRGISGPLDRLSWKGNKGLEAEEAETPFSMEESLN